MIICQECGVILKADRTQCPSCDACVTHFASTPLPLLSQGSLPLAVSVRPDPIILERAVAVAGAYFSSTQNRNGNGNVNAAGSGKGDAKNGGGLASGNGSHTKELELDFGPLLPIESNQASEAESRHVDRNIDDAIADQSELQSPSGERIESLAQAPAPHSVLGADCPSAVAVDRDASAKQENASLDFFASTGFVQAAPEECDGLTTRAPSHAQSEHREDPNLQPEETDEPNSEESSAADVLTVSDWQSKETPSDFAAGKSGINLRARASFGNQLVSWGILIFAVTVMFNACSTVIVHFAATGQQPNLPDKIGRTALSVGGQWQIQSAFNGNNTSGVMQMHQEDGEITGDGRDNLSGGRLSLFTVTGQISDDKQIKFAKTYVERNPRTGKVTSDLPIFFTGVLESQPGQSLSATGKWITRRSVGHFNHRTMKEFSGGWKARQITTATAAADIPEFKTSVGFHFFTEGWSQSQRLFGMALAAIAIIVALIGGALTLFGPAGKINIWEKEKYIPSQYNSQHKKIVREFAKPLQSGGLPLGRRVEWRPWKFWEWGHKELNMPAAVRVANPHILVLGAGDKGKSRLLANMIIHDIKAADRAVVVVDSDGGLVDLVSRWLSAQPDAKALTHRTIIVDPSYKDGSLGYNPLEFPDDGDMQSAASSIVFGFKAVYTEPPGAQSQWNQQTANILRNCAILLMANGKTLTDLPVLLHDNDFRDVMLDAIEKRRDERSEYITLLETWGQYKKLARTEQWITWTEPILNRVSPMLGDARIRNLLTKPIGDVKLKKVITEKMILLVKVPKGQLDQNAKLLGSLMVTGVKQAALSLTNENSESQNPIALYLDEFDHFIDKETIQTITKETDNLKIGLVGASKTLQHLPEDFRNALIISMGTLCSFALGKKDGDMIAPQMFRIDGRKIKHRTIQTFFNRVNTSPQFELIMDEEKLNIDRIVGQESRTFFCYQVGTVAGVFHLRAYNCPDVAQGEVNAKLIEKMHRLNKKGKGDRKGEAADTAYGDH